MKIPRAPHSFRLSPKAAMALQSRLAARVRVEAPARPIRSVVGVDCAFSADGESCLASAVWWDVEDARVLAERHVARPSTFPYVPGLLSFREAPAILAALRKIPGEPDAVMLDGHGLAHMRRFGIACHVGVLCDRPTVGVAKSRLVGEHREPGADRGRRTALRHEGERVGTVLRTRDSTKPVYVSVGHGIDLPHAEQLVLRCGAGYRLPEPTRRADRAVAAFKKRRARAGST